MANNPKQGNRNQHVNSVSDDLMQGIQPPGKYSQRGSNAPQGQAHAKVNARTANDARSAEDARAQEILAKAQQKEQSKKASKKDKKEGGPAAYVRGTVKELKATTWPKPAELVRWCLIVIATVTLFAVGSMVIDNFVADPVVYAISSLDLAGADTFGPLDIALVVVLFASGIGSIFGIYMHAGGDNEGLSDTLSTRLTGGSGQAQKNLDRITLVCIIVFVVCLVLMMIFYPHGTLVSQ